MGSLDPGRPVIVDLRDFLGLSLPQDCLHCNIAGDSDTQAGPFEFAGLPRPGEGTCISRGCQVGSDFAAYSIDSLTDVRDAGVLIGTGVDHTELSHNDWFACRCGSGAGPRCDSASL